MKTDYGVVVFILLCFLGSFQLKAVSTGGITGQVVEKETMKTVAYAEVIFENREHKIKVSANEYGYYLAKCIPAGKYQMTVQFNNRTFVIKSIKICDSFLASLDFLVSNDNALPALVEVPKNELIKALESREAKATANNFNQLSGNIDYDALSETGFDLIGEQSYYVRGAVKLIRGN